MRKLILAVVFVLLGAQVVKAQGVPETARASFVQALTMLKAAKTPEEIALPIELFRDAIRQAPTWPAAHYNLARALELAGKYDESIGEYERYLELQPAASDARAVRDHIYEVQAEKMVAQRQQAAVDTAVQTERDIVADFQGKWEASGCDKSVWTSPRCTEAEMRSGRHWRNRDGVKIATTNGGIILGDKPFWSMVGYYNTNACFRTGSAFGRIKRIGNTVTIHWELRDADSDRPPLPIWGEYRPGQLILSCQRPLDDREVDPREKYSYLIFRRRY